MPLIDDLGHGAMSVGQRPIRCPNSRRSFDISPHQHSGGHQHSRRSRGPLSHSQQKAGLSIASDHALALHTKCLQAEKVCLALGLDFSTKISQNCINTVNLRTAESKEKSDG